MRNVNSERGRVRMSPMRLRRRWRQIGFSGREFEVCCGRVRRAQEAVELAKDKREVKVRKALKSPEEQAADLHIF